MVGEKYTINVDAQHYSYRKQLLTVIPCCHAIAAMNFINVNAEDFIPIWFRRSTYEEIYQYIIFPVNGEVLWERTPYSDVHPPNKRILPRRPKKKGRLEEWELRKENTQNNKGGHRKDCSICRQIAHNRNNCLDKPMDEQTAPPVETTPNAQTEPYVDHANLAEGTATPAETAPDTQTEPHADHANPVKNAPTAETPTTHPPRNEVESQAAPLPAPNKPSQQFRMKLQIMRRP